MDEKVYTQRFNTARRMVETLTLSDALDVLAASGDIAWTRRVARFGVGEHKGFYQLTLDGRYRWAGVAVWLRESESKPPRTAMLIPHPSREGWMVKTALRDALPSKRLAPVPEIRPPAR